jgi:hypothetical protein
MFSDCGCQFRDLVVIGVTRAVGSFRLPSVVRVYREIRDVGLQFRSGHQVGDQPASVGMLVSIGHGSGRS